MTVNAMNMMDKELLNKLTTTANGAITYGSTGEHLLDLQYNIPSLRANPHQFTATLHKAYAENKSLAIRWLLYLRDIQHGCGERNSFRVLFIDFAMVYPEVAIQIIDKCTIHNYGRWDDLIYIWFALREVRHNVADRIIAIIANQLNEDLKKCTKATSLNEDCHISLLGKWMPSNNTSSKHTRFVANELTKALMFTPKQYRKMLSILRKHSNVTEVSTSSNHWEDITYEYVSSYANLKYKDAFLKHDLDRRKEFLTKLKEGKTTINAGALFMYDIINKYRYNIYEDAIDPTLESLWQNIKPSSNLKNTLVVRDGSGSMSCRIDYRHHLTSLDVADSICLFTSQYNTGEFKNKFITFASQPQIVDLSNIQTLQGKLQVLSKYCDYTNTNIKKVFDLILDTAIHNHVSPEDMPERILIISDMQFDGAVGNATQPLFDDFIEKYKEHGYKMPKLIFWNTSIYADQNVPIRQNDLGVTLISGFSKNLVDMVVSDEIDPYANLVKTLMVPRYDCVDLIDF